MEDTYQGNPYDFVNPIRDPELFAGRHEELKEVEYYFELSKSGNPKYFHLSLVGSRSVGKTSLLNIIEDKANKLGLLTVKVPLNMETVKNDVLFFKEVFDGILTKGAEKGLYEGFTGKIYKAFRRVIDTLDIKADIPFLFGTAYIGLKREQNIAGISQHVLLHDLREIYSEAKKKNIQTIVLLFDECDLLAQNEVLLQKIRNAFMEMEGYILVFSGTDRMFPTISDVFSPIPRFFKRINVGNFKNIKETEECLIKPLSEEEKKAFDQTCIGEIHQITNGSPYEINLIAHYMYRRWKEGKNSKIGLSPEVLDDVLNEIERLRKEGHYEIANKIRQYWIDQLKVLMSLLEFPNISKEWLAEFMLLNEIDSLQLKDIYIKKSITMNYIERLKKDGVISEEDERIHFSGDQFDFLYLKYFCASKGVRDIKEFFIGFAEDPLYNLHHKFIEGVLLKDFQEYNIHTAFDKREKIEGSTGQKFIIGVKANLPPGEHTILEISPETQREFYLGTPNSIRLRVNVEWMKEGFVTQVKFMKEEDKERFRSRFNALRDNLDFLGYKILLKDEISWNIEGVEFLRQRKISEAIECFDKAIEINPFFELPWGNKARGFFDLEKYDEALDCLNKALELHPSWSEALSLKGPILIILGKNEEALECLEKVTKINPEDWTAWDNKGRVLCNIGRYKEALECFDRSLKFNPENHKVLYLKGSSLTQLNRIHEALICFDEILKIKPDFIPALLDKAFALSKLGQYKDAIDCCNMILKIDPNNGAAWYNKACFEVNIGNSDSALECLRKAIEINKGFADEVKKDEDLSILRNDERLLSLIQEEQKRSTDL